MDITSRMFSNSINFILFFECFLDPLLEKMGRFNNFENPGRVFEKK